LAVHRQAADRRRRHARAPPRAVEGGPVILRKTPLRDKLAPALRDGDARRLWQGVDARRAVRPPGAPVRRAAPAGAALAAALLLIIWIWPAGARDKKALSLADGRDLVALESAPGSADDTALSDGSHIARDPGARLRVLENTGSVVDML